MRLIDATGFTDGSPLLTAEAQNGAEVTIDATLYSAFCSGCQAPDGSQNISYIQGQNHGQRDETGVTTAQQPAAGGTQAFAIDGNNATAGVATMDPPAELFVASDATQSSLTFTLTGTPNSSTTQSGKAWIAGGSAPNTNGFTSIASAANGAIVGVCAAGSLNRAAYSLDLGQTWTAGVTPAGDLTWRGVCSGVVSATTRFVAVANSGTGSRVMTSDDNGANWTSRTSAADSNWRAVCAGLVSGAIRFVAVANSGVAGARVQYSDNGTTGWTAATAPNTNNLIDVAWGTVTATGVSYYVAIAQTGVGNRISYSTTGSGVWTAGTSAEDNTWNSIAFGFVNGVGTWVAVASDGTNRLMYATDPTGTWTPVSIAANTWQQIRYGGGLWVATSTTVGVGNQAMYAVDPAGTWAFANTTVDQAWNRLCYAVLSTVGAFVCISSGSVLPTMRSTGNQVFSVAGPQATNPAGANYKRTAVTAGNFYLCTEVTVSGNPTSGVSIGIFELASRMMWARGWGGALTPYTLQDGIAQNRRYYYSTNGAGLNLDQKGPLYLVYMRFDSGSDPGTNYVQINTAYGVSSGWSDPVATSYTGTGTLAAPPIHWSPILPIPGTTNIAGIVLRGSMVWSAISDATGQTWACTLMAQAAVFPNALVDSINTGTKTFTLNTAAGNLTSNFVAGYLFGYTGGGANAGVYSVASSAWDGTNTTVVTVQAIPSATTGGQSLSSVSVTEVGLTLVTPTRWITVGRVNSGVSNMIAWTSADGGATWSYLGKCGLSLSGGWISPDLFTFTRPDGAYMILSVFARPSTSLPPPGADHLVAYWVRVSDFLATPTLLGAGPQFQIGVDSSSSFRRSGYPALMPDRALGGGNVAWHIETSDNTATVITQFLNLNSILP